MKDYGYRTLAAVAGAYELNLDELKAFVDENPSRYGAFENSAGHIEVHRLYFDALVRDFRRKKSANQ